MSFTVTGLKQQNRDNVTQPDRAAWEETQPPTTGNNVQDRYKNKEFWDDRSEPGVTSYTPTSRGALVLAIFTVQSLIFVLLTYH